MINIGENWRGNREESRDTGNIGHNTQNEKKKFKTENQKDEQQGPVIVYCEMSWLGGCGV